MIYTNSALIRSIIAGSFLFSTVACGNSGANGIKVFENEKDRKKFVEEGLKKADEVIEKLKKIDKERSQK
ncbi:hypothetical protein [Cardinium endosymbiont of Nabis limbatus]|uniref:hypothetical protein n=1 Tax=Cardinium endosymbiont of Nabis limbatus TaxID=3066217 RepID=UPI003AF33570